MRILVLDSALARCSVALVVDNEVTMARAEERKQGHEAVLPIMAREVMHDTGVGEEGSLDCIAVTVGPGSFTGIRAGIALAQGIGLAMGVPVIGVTVGEAIADAFPHLRDRELWSVTDSRRGHVFLERGAEIVSLPLEELPKPERNVAIAGTAASQVAARLAAAGVNVMLTDARFPQPRHIASIAARRHTGILAPRTAQPLYVDPPQAKVSAGGSRPPPEAR
jgi:tRNA threonylcarbamoyladenosine biosynthesis protein TsaB